MTNIMDLPKFNPATEGTFSISLVFIFTAIFGCDIWLYEIDILMGIRVNQLVMLGFLIFAVIGTPLVFKLYLFQQYIDFNIK